MSNIFVYHGDNIVSSRQAILAKVSQYDPKTTEVIRVEGKHIDDNFIQTNLFSASMFQDSRLIVIENLFSLLKSESKDKIIKSLCLATDVSVIIWENKEIETKSYSAPFIFQVFKLPNELFSFLDRINPDNPGDSLLILEKVKDQVDENYIFLMLVRQIRLLIMAKGKETATLLPWQVGKLQKQAEMFTENQLYGFYRQLRDIDYHQKTSQGIGGIFEAKLNFLFPVSSNAVEFDSILVSNHFLFVTSFFITLI